MEQQKIILAMYSGGLDSLGMIYRLLTDEKYVNYFIHIHHIHIKNVEDRDRAEAAQVELALRELTAMGLEYGYSQSEIASPVFVMDDGTAMFLFDTDTISFFAGFACSVDTNIVHVAIGMNSTERPDTGSANLLERRRRADAILALFTSATKIYPVADFSKQEIYHQLPDRLRDKFWSCRTPDYQYDLFNMKNVAKECGTCKTCLQLKEAGIR
jgi:7-cyano-7-deazaguanine synthase in queuosine biosynthesis